MATSPKRTVKRNGKATSIALEDVFWNMIKAFAKEDGKTLDQYVTDVAIAARLATGDNFSSALRVHVATRMLLKINALELQTKAA